LHFDHRVSSLPVTVIIPAALSQYAGNTSNVVVEATTVNEALLKLDEQIPGLSSFILDESGSVRRYVNIFVNDSDIRSGAGPMTKLKDGDRIHIVPAVAGG